MLVPPRDDRPTGPCPRAQQARAPAEGTRALVLSSPLVTVLSQLCSSLPPEKKFGVLFY